MASCTRPWRPPGSGRSSSRTRSIASEVSASAASNFLKSVARTPAAGPPLRLACSSPTITPLLFVEPRPSLSSVYFFGKSIGSAMRAPDGQGWGDTVARLRAPSRGLFCAHLRSYAGRQASGVDGHVCGGKKPALWAVARRPAQPASLEQSDLGPAPERGPGGRGRPCPGDG